jgi:Putative GTPase activating protein for Arf
MPLQSGYHTFDNQQQQQLTSMAATSAAAHNVNDISSSSSSDYEMKAEDFSALQALDGNLQCVDCRAKNPDWGSPALGILFCFKCSGVHR